MTPAELEQLVLSGDPEKLAEAVAPLTEKERLALSGAASETRRALEKMAASTKGTSDKLPGLIIMAELAMLAVSRVRSVPTHACALKILCDRNPEWLDEWLEEILRAEWPEIEWETLRELVRRGMAKTPTSEGYVRLMVQGLPDQCHVKNYRPLSQKLLADPDLLEDELWRLFEVETHAFSLDQSKNNPHAPANYESWSTAVLKLAADGRIDRERLLDASLSGLTAGFKKGALSGYIKLHEEMQPSLVELFWRQKTYLKLLASQTGHVVTFALERLKVLEEGGRLDGPALFEAIGGLFEARMKAQPMTALGLIGRVVNRDPGLTEKAARVVAEVLKHYSPLVQEGALQLLEEWGDQVEPTLARRLEERLREVSSKHRDRLRRVVVRLESRATGATDEAAACAPHVRERAASVSPETHTHVGVDASVSSLENNAFFMQADANLVDISLQRSAGPVEPIAFAGSLESGDSCDPPDVGIVDVSVLRGVDPVAPIASVDELIDAVAHALEVIDSATEVERILDGISRLCDQRPEDFESRTAPLVTRIREKSGVDSNGFLGSWGVPRALSCVVMVWLVRARPRLAPDSQNPDTGARKAIAGRLLELARRVVRGVAAPLLAAPTHARGWIDPERFVARVLELQASRIEIPRFDLVQALLRLAPDGRKCALVEAKSIEGKFGWIIRWALGGNATPTNKDSQDAPLWVAAGRSRAPRERLEKLTVLGISEQIPDALTPATYAWEITTTGQADAGGDAAAYGVPQLKIESTPRFTAVSREEFPSASLHEHANQYSVLGVQSPWLIEWISMLWPLNQDAFLAAGAMTIARCIDVEASSFEPGHPFIAPLLESAGPWSEMAMLTEWLGLLSKSVDTRRAAIDALVAGIQNCQVDPAAMSRMLVRLNVGGWLKLDRVASALGEVAGVSGLTQSVVATTLDAFVGALKTMPRDAYHVLSLLLEVLTELELGVSYSLRGVLKTVEGSKKTTRLTNALLELKQQGDLVC